MKKVLALVLTLVMILSLAACSSTATTAAPAETTAAAAETTAAAPAAGDDIKVGVVLKTLSSEYWGYVAAGVKAAAADLNVTVDLQGPPSETSFDEHINMVETMLSAGDYDALAIAPLQPDQITTALANATIPVLFVDTDAPYTKKVSFIGTGNEAAAKLGGEWAAKTVGSGKKAVLIAGVQGDTTSEARMAGYRAGLEAGGVEVIDIQYADGTADKAVAVMETFMQKYDQIDAVLCNNDDMAMGAARAAAQAGKSDIVFIGFDGISSGVQAIIDGKESASVAQSPFMMGYAAVENAVKAAKGEAVEARIDTGAKVIDTTNAAEYLAELNKMLGK